MRLEPAGKAAKIWGPSRLRMTVSLCDPLGCIVKSGCGSVSAQFFTPPLCQNDALHIKCEHLSSWADASDESAKGRSSNRKGGGQECRPHALDLRIRQMFK